MSRCLKRRLDESLPSSLTTEKNESKKAASNQIEKNLSRTLCVAGSPGKVKRCENEDSDIEFLLTILPPSPEKKKKSLANREELSVQPTLESSSRTRQVAPDQNDAPETPQRQQVDQDQTESYNRVAMTSSRDLKPSYKTSVHTWRRSAYLQSLAEICHAILWDARWRAGEERLFSWERGDDLSAVLSLSRRFLRLELPAPKTCSCLMLECPILQGKASEGRATIADGNTNVDTEEDNEECYDRSLNLYCRLYFRKGPFFRIDDLFNKYYSPKQESPAPIVEQQSPSPTKLQKRTNFFLPKKKESCIRSHDKFIDSDLLQSQFDAASLLLEDLHNLNQMGLFRTFEDEEECGKTVGEVIRYGLLSQNEQVQILQLLGCKKRQSSPKTSENLVWKQMTQQQSISRLAAAGANHVLPVAKHVDQTILASWATSIVLKASKLDYVRTPILRSLTEMVKAELLEMIGAHSFSTCVRHREAPLKTLRRCCRLYLCATSGPGNMRGDGATAWKSLPDSHSKDLTKVPLAKLIPPPGSHCWHSVSYPGKDHRFRLRSCNFIRAHEPLFIYDENRSKSFDPTMIQAFCSIEAFSAWELTVEIRAYVDYLIALRDTLRYNDRRKAKQGEADDGDGNDNDSSTRHEIDDATVDFYDLLTKAGRDKIARRLMLEIGMLSPNEAPTLCSIEEDVKKVDLAFSNDDSLKIHTECDKVLAVIAIVSMHILTACCERSNPEKVQLASRRPWMRHLRWEGCLAYILWDAVKTLECKMEGFYELAVKALEVLLFGKAYSSPSLLPAAIPQSSEPTLADYLISRRARGKAYERLAIDSLHVLRLRQQELRQKQETAGKLKAGKKLQKASSPTEIVSSYSKTLLDVSVPTGRIPFSAIRTLAKRIKQPLSATLGSMASPETAELGHRYSSTVESLAAKDEHKYSEWVPTVDHTVAIAMGVDEASVGKRCSYVGFEDGGNDSLNVGSLNVEQLAKEYYKTGRLPINDTSQVCGGWVGWHDEGGKVRQLWRVLSSVSVLGMDFGCQVYTAAGNPQESATIFMTPYQSAPFDLHCGAELNGNMIPSRGFYERRKDCIEAFLKQLASLQPNEVADLVYTSVEARFSYSEGLEHNDPTLGRDVQHLRSLSLLAAGLGGEMLSAISRCFFFDYRHYSGGLPDLTLVRAVSAGALVDLGGWIGEGFAAGNSEGPNIFDDRDSDFLGCSKVGDSGASNRFGRGQSRAERHGDSSKDTLLLPARLELLHEGKPVKVECMFSEVKSQNDRLDARQEDWLNILDKYGNARVCKFGGKGRAAKTSQQTGSSNSPA